MWAGEWFGSWFGSWFGPSDSTPSADVQQEDVIFPTFHRTVAVLFEPNSHIETVSFVEFHRPEVLVFE